ncbi:MAG: hypothetical protein Q8N99_01215 [Nanoarchaeota archaeon]|nr:hypothetical protein [Nanoarchaeota archaeon]
MKRGEVIFIIAVIFLSLSVFAYDEVLFLLDYGLLEIGIQADVSINIASPLNITYNFDIGSDYELDLNVSSYRNLSSWWYRLYDLRHNEIVNQSVIFAPNTSINAVRWENLLTVYANDSVGNIFNQSVYFYVHVNNSAPIIENLSNKFICEGESLTYTFNSTDIDEDIPSASLFPQYPNNPFYITDSPSFIYSLTRFEFEIYSGILNKNDAGGVNSGSVIYKVNVSVSDRTNSDRKEINLTVIEKNNYPNITNIGVKTVWLNGSNSTFYYKINQSDMEDGNQDSGNISFYLVFSGASLFNISGNGIMNYTPNLSQLGVYNISVCAVDSGIKNPHPNISICSQNGSNLTSCRNYSLTVTNENRAPVITSYYNTNLSLSANGLAALYFNISTNDPDGTIPDIYWYMDDSLLEYVSFQSIDSLSYSFSCGVSGIHFIKAYITDGALNSSVTWNITVSEVACLPATGASGGGGGGTSKCIPKFGCEEYKNCILVSSSNFLNKTLIRNRCNLYNWKEENCGVQFRSCIDTKKCNSTLMPELYKECYYTRIMDCFDNIKNCHNGSCEILTDCGEPCAPCPTCTDNIKNQEEEDIDCGGPCKPCLIEQAKKLFIDKKVIILRLIYILFILMAVIIIFQIYRLLKKQIFFNRKTEQRTEQRAKEKTKH